VRWSEEFHTKFQSIRLTAGYLLAHAITQVQPQLLIIAASVVRQAEVIHLHYAKHAAYLQPPKPIKLSINLLVCGCSKAGLRNHKQFTLLTIIQYSITHSLFHSRLKTFLFCKSFPPLPFLFSSSEFTT